MSEQLLEVADLEVHFPVGGLGRRGLVRAVDGLSFDVGRAESIGLVGESGCGKSTTGMAIQGLVKATGGSVRLRGKELLKLSSSERRAERRHTQMIFQDPTSSLNARMTIEQTLTEPLVVHRLREPGQYHARVLELLDLVGLPQRYARRFPHEFSGGQRQRIAIARALAAEPSLITCDEPIAALDVSIRAQVLNLLLDLREQAQLAYVFISHDLSAVYHVADRIMVMYLGKPMELADRESLHEQTRHPYTAALLSALPVPDPDIEAHRERILLGGELPSPLNPPSGCVFRTRCPVAQEPCAEQVPEWRDIGERGQPHYVACHFPLETGTHGGEALLHADAT